MSNSPINDLSAGYAWRGKAPGSAEFVTILNQLPQAAIVVEPRSNFVLAANSDFLRLTAFSSADLQNLEVSTLFPEYSRYLFTQDQAHQVMISRHKRDGMDVTARSTALDPAANRVLLTITPRDQRSDQRVETEKLNGITSFFEVVLAQLTAEGLIDAAANILHQAQELTGVSFQGVYTYNPRLDQYQKLVSTEAMLEIFPDVIPGSTYPDLTEPDLWEPGKRILNELHRVGRIGNLSFIAAFPLSQNNTRMGLLVMADTVVVQEESFVTYAKLVAKGLQSLIYNFAIIENIKDTLNEHIRSLATRDAAISNALEGIILVKKDLTIEEMNPAAEFILGYASNEVTGEPVENILVGPDTLVPALKSALNGVPTHNLGNVLLHRRDGRPFLSHLQTLPVIYQNDLERIIILVRDESENEQIRIKTQQLEQRAVLGELTAIMAHEIRNPVNNINTGLQVLTMDFKTDDPNFDIAQRLQQDCMRLTHLVESILSFSKPWEYRLVPSDLGMMLQRMMDRWKPRFAKANIQAMLTLDPDLKKVIGDLRALEQVFTNLVTNALAVMTSGGVLAIRAENRVSTSEQYELVVTVTDTGPGIPDEIREHMFEAFVSNNPQGTGLGLAISKRIVLAHKGNISVSSFPGGTVFYVTLPAQK